MGPVVTDLCSILVVGLALLAKSGSAYIALLISRPAGPKDLMVNATALPKSLAPSNTLPVVPLSEGPDSVVVLVSNLLVIIINMIALMHILVNL